MGRKKKRKKQKAQPAQKQKKSAARKAALAEQPAPVAVLDAPPPAAVEAPPLPAVEAQPVAVVAAPRVPEIEPPPVPAVESAAPAEALEPPPGEIPRPSPAPPRPSIPAAPPVEVVVVEDLDADLDEDDASYESLVALVAGLPDDSAPAGAPASRGSRPDDAKLDANLEEAVEILDLDDDEGTEAIDRLIAKAVVGAPAVQEEVEPEAPLIDLDADEPAASPTRAAAGPGAPTRSEAERLAAVVARSAIDETDIPAISLDLGEVSTPEARARLLAEALAHAEHKEARYRVPMDTGTARRWKSLAATGIFVLAAWVAAAPPGWVRPEPPAQLNAAARVRNIRTALLLQAEQIEAFRVRTQRLPNSLDELPATLPGVRYARSGNRAYQLIGYEPDGNAVVYDSTNPSAGFRVLLAAWPPAEAAP